MAEEDEDSGETKLRAMMVRVAVEGGLAHNKCLKCQP